jgi:hypothetical protein
MKQTAMQDHIKWLYEVLDNVHAQQMNSDIVQAIEYVIQGAKAKLPLEKEQIINAWIADDNKLQRLAAEQYYNENYGNKS